MNTPNGFHQLPGLFVTVDRVEFRPEAKTPSDRPFCFVYYITIHNEASLPVTIKGRKWVVTTDRGEITAVEADGVIGEFPTIFPGKKFSYNSYHLINSRVAVAEGSYIGIDAGGRKVLARIPAFKLLVPNAP